jgi:hypothetical protein
MENNENNKLSELDQLKAQYEILKQQFDQQEIVNDRLMKSSIKQGTDFYRRNRMRSIIMCPLAAIFGLLGIKLWFGNNLSLSLFWVAFMFTCLVIELVLTRKFQRKTLGNDDLLVLSHTARSFKKLFSVFTVLNYSTGLILVCGLLMSLVGTNYNGGPMMLTFLAVVVGMIVLGISEVRYKTRPCDEIIRQIDASDNTIINRKTGIDRKQRWFCVAMLVAFIGLDIWAYTIVGTYLKLPPMWRNVTYKRPDTKIPAEEQLSVWEVYADTVVAPTEVSAVTEKWQQNESLVVMKGFGDDEAQVQLYALKMNSPEGPIVSSARIGGKPVVEEVVARESVFNKDQEEKIPVIIRLTPEAGQLWHDYFQTGEKIESLDIALVVDGMVYHKTNFTSLHGVTNKSFSIGWIWRKDKLDDFCERLIRQ